MIFDDILRRTKEGIKKAVGGSIREPFVARLGRETPTGERELQPDNADEPNLYYYHDFGSKSSFGIAKMQDGAVQEDDIRFGTFVRIKPDELNKEDVIASVDTRFNSEFKRNVPKREEVIIVNYDGIAPGLILPTNPPSMKAVVVGGSYNIGDSWKYYDTQTTVDWSTSPYNANLPSSGTKQVFALVSIDFDTGALSYSYGSEVSSGLKFKNALKIDRENGNNNILPVPTSNREFRIGYVRLLLNKSTLERGKDIFPLQDFMSRGADASILDNIVTSSGEVVVSDGNVVYATSTA